MKNKLIIITVLLIYLGSFGQSEAIKLLDKADSIEKLISKNWKLLSSTNGDLNKGGISDLVFVIEITDKNNIHLTEGYLGRDSINLNPRIMDIYFRNKNKKLIKKLQSYSFIILRDSSTMDEPFQGIEILKNGDLKFDFIFGIVQEV